MVSSTDSLWDLYLCQWYKPVAGLANPSSGGSPRGDVGHLYQWYNGNGCQWTTFRDRRRGFSRTCDDESPHVCRVHGKPRSLRSRAICSFATTGSARRGGLAGGLEGGGEVGGVAR